MTLAASNLSYLRYLAEPSYGTVGSGAPKPLRFTGESIKYNVQTDTSKEIRSDRQVADLIQLSGSVSGGVQFEYSHSLADDLIEAAAGGTWTSVTALGDVEDLFGLEADSLDSAFRVSNGVNMKYFSFEKGFTDIQHYQLFTGLAVNQFSLDFQTASILTGSLDFMGKLVTLKDGSSNFTTPASAAPSGEPFNSASNFGKILLSGTELQDTFIQSLSFNINNQLRGPQGLGHMGPVAIRPGTQLITGTAEVYFESGTLYQNFLNNSSFSMAWSAQDAGGNGIGIYLPRVKWSDGTIQSGSLDQDVMVSLPFQALVHPTTSRSMEIYRYTSVAP